MIILKFMIQAFTPDEVLEGRIIVALVRKFTNLRFDPFKG